jgi:hypothetical protein
MPCMFYFVRFTCDMHHRSARTVPEASRFTPLIPVEIKPEYSEFTII